jgi:hypothetical protein
MILTAKINDSLAADIELNFTTNTWNVPPATAKWGGVMYSDRGLFEVKPWGVIWLMDAKGSAKKDCTVILHAAPTDDGTALSQNSGTGRVYAPAMSTYRDCEIQWRLLRRSASPALAAAKSSGASTAVRMKAKQIAESLLPKAGKLTNGQPAENAKGTGCGEFPGRVMRRMPVLGPGQHGAFEIEVRGAGKLSLTSPTIYWEDLAKAIDEKYTPVKKTWVAFNGSNRPKTGDIYVLAQFEKKSDFQHVGMIISAEGGEWVTADGGQGNGWQSGFITRKFYSTGQIDGEKGNKAWLKGWVDLDNLRDVLRQYFPSHL